MNINHLKDTKMKNNIKFSFLSFVMGGMLLASCSNDIDVATVDESKYDTNVENLAFITDKYGASNCDSLIFSDNGSTDFYVNRNQAASTAASYTIAYDEQVLANYNAEHGTSYQAMPKDLVTIEGNGDIESGKLQSSAVKVSYKTAESLAQGQYAIPLSIQGQSVSKDKGSFILLVNDITKLPNCHKESGLQVVSCMSINTTNPLTNLCFTLKNSGKFFFDQVILFSGNINYNEETGRVYNFNNENVQAVLDYREKYIVPLQQKGMKVILGILGNHDRAALTRLTEEGAKDFAMELKKVMDAYNLDGIFFDDEYSTPGNYPGFEPNDGGGYNVSRLCYYLKQYAPDKLVEVYVYGGTYRLVSVEGHQPGDFCDYAIQDYRRYGDLSSNYPGMPKTGMIQYSSEFAQGRNINAYYSKKIVTDGYGGTMIYALNPLLGRMYLSAMNDIAQAFYGEEIVYDGKPYEIDWQ